MLSVFEPSFRGRRNLLNVNSLNLLDVSFPEMTPDKQNFTQTRLQFKHHSNKYNNTTHYLEGPGAAGISELFLPKEKLMGTLLLGAETLIYPCISWCSALQKSVQ